MSWKVVNALSNLSTALSSVAILQQLEDTRLEASLNSPDVIEYDGLVEKLCKELCIRLNNTDRRLANIKAISSARGAGISEETLKSLFDSLASVEEQSRALCGFWMLWADALQENISANDEASAEYPNTLKAMLRICSMIYEGAGHRKIPVAADSELLNSTDKIIEAFDAIDLAQKCSQYAILLSVADSPVGSRSEEFDLLLSRGIRDPLFLEEPIADDILEIRFRSSISYYLVVMYSQVLLPIVRPGAGDPEDEETGRYENIFRERDCFGKAFRDEISSVPANEINELVLLNALQGLGVDMAIDQLRNRLYPEKAEQNLRRLLIELSIDSAARKGLISSKPEFRAKAKLESRPSQLPGRLTVIVDGKKVAIVPLVETAPD